MSAPASRAYPGLGHAVLMTVALLGLQIFFGVIFGIAHVIANHGRAPTEAGPAIPPLALVVINGLAFAVVLGWAALANRGRPRARWHGHSGGVSAKIAGLVAAGGAFLVIAYCADLLERLVPASGAMADLFADLMDIGAHPVGTILAIVVVAAVGEEWVFRGYILRGLLDHMRPAAAVWISAGLFTLMHANLWQMPVGLGLGLLCGFVYLRTRSLPLCIAMHALNNSLALAAFKHAAWLDPVFGGTDTSPDWWVPVIGAVVVFGGVGWLAVATRGCDLPPPLPEVAEPVPAGEREGPTGNTADY